MTDFYVMLGLLRTASEQEIRAAYLARMKVLHPDRHASLPPDGPSAADLNLAYWTLRDRDRRAAYDRVLAPRPVSPRGRPRPQRGSREVTQARRPVKKGHYPRRSAYSVRARAVVSIGFVLIAAAVAAATLTIWRPDRSSEALGSSAALVDEEQINRPGRRTLDEVLAGAAASEFQAILHVAGFSGASRYGRQCFEELALQPSIAMADYCLAFDRTASEWERTLVTERSRHRYFDVRSRRARYQRLADNLAAGPVRAAIAAEAAYLSENF